MIIDSNLVLFEGALSSAAQPVGLTSLKIPGKMEPILISMVATETLAGATKVDIKLTQSDAESGTYEEVPGVSISVPAAQWVEGTRMGFRYLPRNVTKQWIKLGVTVTGSATAGKLFAALVREDSEPYEAGMYIDAGVVKG